MHEVYFYTSDARFYTLLESLIFSPGGYAMCLGSTDSGLRWMSECENENVVHVFGKAFCFLLNPFGLVLEVVIQNTLD